MKKLFVLALVTLATLVCYTQSISSEAIKIQLIKDWEISKELTNRYLNIMPADKYSFKAHDSTRSFAQQMLHLAQVSAAMVCNGTGAPRLFPR